MWRGAAALTCFSVSTGTVTLFMVLVAKSLCGTRLSFGFRVTFARTKAAPHPCAGRLKREAGTLPTFGTKISLHCCKARAEVKRVQSNFWGCVDFAVAEHLTRVCRSVGL